MPPIQTPNKCCNYSEFKLVRQEDFCTKQERLEKLLNRLLQNFEIDELYFLMGEDLFLLQFFPAVPIGVMIDIQQLGGFTFIALGHF